MLWVDFWPRVLLPLSAAVPQGARDRVDAAVLTS